MKLGEAYRIILEEAYNKVKNQDDMSARVNEAINALDKDIEKLSEWIREYNKMGFKLNIS